MKECRGHWGWSIPGKYNPLHQISRAHISPSGKPGAWVGLHQALCPLVLSVYVMAASLVFLWDSQQWDKLLLFHQQLVLFPIVLPCPASI